MKKEVVKFHVDVVYVCFEVDVRNSQSYPRIPTCLDSQWETEVGNLTISD